MTDDNTGGYVGPIDGDQQTKSVADAAQYLLDMTRAGDWAIDEETGTYLRKAFAEALAELTMIGNKTYLLERAPKVGNDAYAREVSQHMLESVNSDRHSLLPVFDGLQDTLAQWRDAIDVAINNYDAADEAAPKHFGPFKD